MTESPSKPFWKPKRWIVAAVLWLAITYPLSLGAVEYVDARGWTSAHWYPALRVIYWPILAGYVPGWLSNYYGWCHDMGRHHATSG